MKYVEMVLTTCVTVAIVCLTLGCAGDVQLEEEELVGTWVYDSILYVQIAFEDDGTYHAVSQVTNNDHDNLNIQDFVSMPLFSMTIPEEGTWTVTDDRISLSHSDEWPGLNMHVSKISVNEFKCIIGRHDVEMTFSRVEKDAEKKLRDQGQFF